MAGMHTIMNALRRVFEPVFFLAARAIFHTRGFQMNPVAAEVL
jgi:hypothetical protein